MFVIYQPVVVGAVGFFFGWMLKGFVQWYSETAAENKERMEEIEKEHAHRLYLKNKWKNETRAEFDNRMATEALTRGLKRAGIELPDWPQPWDNEDVPGIVITMMPGERAADFVQRLFDLDAAKYIDEKQRHENGCVRA